MVGVIKHTLSQKKFRVKRKKGVKRGGFLCVFTFPFAQKSNKTFVPLLFLVIDYSGL